MSLPDLDRMDAALRHNGRVRVAAIVIVVCVWGDCILFGGWWGLLLGWICALFLAFVIVQVVGFEAPPDI